MKLVNILKVLLVVVSFNLVGMQSYETMKQAIIKGKINDVREFLKQEIDNNPLEEDQLSLFALAIQHAEAVFGKTNNDIEQKKALNIVKLFLQKDVKVNQFIGPWNANPLEWLLLKPKPAIILIQLLIAYGADAEDEVLALLPKNSAELKQELSSVAKFKQRIDIERPVKLPLRYLIVHKNAENN